MLSTQDHTLKPICEEWVSALETLDNQQHHPSGNYIWRQKVAALSYLRIEIQRYIHRCQIYYRHIFAI